MKKRIIQKILPRIIIFFSITVVMLAVTGYIIVSRMFNPQAVRAVIFNQLQETFKRPLTIRDTEFSLTGKIRITDLRVFSLPDEPKGNFLEARVIYAVYDWTSLLTKKISINKLYFESPKINLIKKKDGSWNFASMFRGKSRKRISAIKKTRIKNAFIKLENLRSGIKHVFSGVNFEISDFAPYLESPFHLSARLKVSGKRKIKGDFDIEGGVNFADFNWKNAYLKNVRLKSEFMGYPLKLKLNLENFRNPCLRIKLDTPGLTWAALKKFLQKPAKINMPPAMTEINLKFDTEKKEVSVLSANIQSKDINISFNGDLVISTSALNYSITAFSRPFSLREINRIFPDCPVRNLAGKGQFKIKVVKNGDKINFSRIFANADDVSFVYNNIRLEKLNTTALILENMEKSKFNLKIGKAVVSQNTFLDTSVNARIRKNLLRLDLSSNWKGKPMKMLLEIDRPFSNKKNLNLNVFSGEMDIGPMNNVLKNIAQATRFNSSKKSYKQFSSIKWVNKVRNSIPSGYAGINLNFKFTDVKHEYFKSRQLCLSAKLRNFSGDISKVKGNVAIKSENGNFFKVEENSRKNRIYKIISLPILIMYKMNRFSALKIGVTLKDIFFNSIGAEYSLDMGKIHIKNFYMDGKEFSAYSTGDLNLIKETINLKVYTISNKRYAMGTLPQMLTDQSGKPALAFRIKGKMDNPDLKMLNPGKTGKIIEQAKKRGVPIDTSKTRLLKGGE